ncbi:MAG: glycosyltransferase family 4 protein [Bacteriovoracaceae bacterium]|nr:glycosyltransferase family 4 protein [Bacteriovoracaceae bacterium]
MKICFFTENYYKGGLDTFLINLINAWPGEKDELILVCNGTHLGLDTITENTKRPLEIKRYYRLFTSALAQGHRGTKWSQSFPVRAFFVLAFRFLQYPILFPWYVFTLAKYFRSSDFDRLMVVNGGYPASLLCRSAVIAWRLAGKRPLAVMNFHNSATRPIWYFGFIENMIDRLIIRSASHFVSVSQDCLDSLNSRNAFIDCSKLSFIYNGIDDPVKLLKTVLSKAKTESPRYCLMLATYEARKGHTYLLQAFQSIVKDFPDVQLQIYGHGRHYEKKQVADEVRQLGLEDNVKLGDFTTRAAELLAGASVLVVPSQAYESFGLTIIEAMALGVPVVTTNVGGMPEVIGDSNAGYVCSKDDPLEFANAIKGILRNPALASEHGKNGRIAFERRFSADKMAASYSKLLE